MRWNSSSALVALAVAAGAYLTFATTRSIAQPRHGARTARVSIPRDHAELRRELATRTEAMLAAFRRNDVQGIARTFADDATILGPQGARVQGRAAIDRYWKERARPTTWVIETLDVGGSRDEPWQFARSIRTTVVDGVPSQTITTFVLVWKRDRAGVLRIHLDLYT